MSSGSAFAVDAPLPCKVLPAADWSKVVGSVVTAIPGDMNCSYDGKASGGQFRILVVSSSAAQARAAVTMYSAGIENTPGAGRSVIDSQGNIVFSIALFQDEITASTPAQLQGLLAVVKRNLPK